MTHEIDMSNGRANFAFAGEHVTPWHGLGHDVKPGTSIADWQRASGMDYKLLRSKVRFATERDQDPKDYAVMDDRHVLFRNDTGAGMGIVSDGYEIVQPSEVWDTFAELMTDLGLEMRTGGCLFGGRRYFAMAETTMKAQIGGDELRKNLLVSTSCDGSMATEARWTDIVVVCRNTLAAARNGKAAYKVPHRSKFDRARMRAELGLDSQESAFDSQIAEFVAMSERKCTDQELIGLTLDLVKPDWREMGQKDLAKALARENAPIRSIARKAIDGSAIGGTLDGRDHTVWGWLNSVTEWADHNAGRSQDNRLNSAWFGPNAALKQRAYGLASDVTKLEIVLEDSRLEDASLGLLDRVIAATPSVAL